MPLVAQHQFVAILRAQGWRAPLIGTWTPGGTGEAVAPDRARVAWRAPRDSDDRNDSGDRDDEFGDPEYDERPGERRRGHLRLVGSHTTDRSRRPEPSTPHVDPLEELLRIPDGASLPDVAIIERIEPQLPKSRELATVLRDALGHLRIEWD